MEIKSIFSDIGGVCLSNAWEFPSRQKAAKHFSLDEAETENRHRAAFHPFECGQLSLHEYLSQVVFYQPRSFSEQDFISFMKAESKPYAPSLAIYKQLRQSGKYLMAVINNESRELNDFRIQTHGLKECFSLFFSSCYLGIRKPDPRIYQIALQVTGQAPKSSLFVDDRRENILAAQAQGMNTIHLKDPADLKEELKGFGISVP